MHWLPSVEAPPFAFCGLRQFPDQLAGTGAAKSVTVDPSGNVELHVEPQLIPVGALVITEPAAPAPSLITVRTGVCDGPAPCDKLPTPTSTAPLADGAVARIVVEPGPMAVARPVTGLIVATCAMVDDHCTPV